MLKHRVTRISLKSYVLHVIYDISTDNLCGRVRIANIPEKGPPVFCLGIVT